MTTIGNLLLMIATFIFFASLSIVLGKTEPCGGDAVMGYTWVRLFWHHSKNS